MSKYHCDKCDKLIKPDPTAIKVGDKVSVTTSRTTGSNTRLRAVDVRVIEDIGGGEILVKGPGRFGHKVVKRDAVSPADAPTSLSYAFIGVCECGGAA